MQGSYDEYREQARYRSEYERAGQHAFNVLYHTRPDLADRIRATNLDPFYDDERLPEFHKWLMEHWDD